MLKAILFTFIFTSFILLSPGFAIEPQEFCDNHNAAAQNDPALGKCDPCGPRCVKLTDNQVGSHFYKKCPEGGTTCLEPENCKEECIECDCEP